MDLISEAGEKPWSMLAPELVAYPTLLVATYALFRLGRRRPVSYRDSFEWVRACSLAILLGLLVAVQVHLVLVGSITNSMGILSMSLGFAGATCLVGLNAYEIWEARGEARAPSAQASAL